MAGFRERCAVLAGLRLAMILGCAGLGSVKGDVTDPVGYTTLEAVPGEQRVLALGLHRTDGLRVPASSASGNVITLDREIAEENVVGLGSCFVQVREGPREGVSMRVASISGATPPSPPGDPVEGRGAHRRVSVGADVNSRLIVRDAKQNVGTRLLRGRGRETGGGEDGGEGVHSSGASSFIR